jgi:RNA polymerase sigma-70 factor (ECF subfamily)
MSAVGESGPPVLHQKSARPLPARLVERLYAKANAAKWPLSQSAFLEALERSAAHRSPSSGAPEAGADLGAYLESLHLEDLALAGACAEGNEAAWEHFVREFRPALYAAARAIVGSAGSPQAGESAARELADSLYADLFGLSEAERVRNSLFRYFHGRSKLSTWLRAVLAQRHVDAVRAARRTESLDTEHERGSEATLSNREAGSGTGVWPYAGTNAASADPERERYLALLQAALTAALKALEPRERLRLSYYYVQDLTLAQIGRLLGEHEATVSRKLERTRRELRKQVESALADAPHRLSAAQLELCFEYARGEWPFDLTQWLSSGADPPGEKRER